MPTNSTDQLGPRIREVRVACGFSQKRLAARCGIAAADLSKYELGRRLPTLDSLARIAEALGVPLQEFFLFSMACREPEPVVAIRQLLQDQPEPVLRLALLLVTTLVEEGETVVRLR
ncbi:MAG: helix-turn-helix transcriptional regulator [Alphaproteobacteria bacterium]|nr:helix-turn-helix transcriptional regulator [Alphaproteobacteria bacterium]